VSRPAIAVAPCGSDALTRAIESGGGALSEPERADGLVWTDPASPGALVELLGRCPARWVQLPFAGIEAFFAAGAIDPARTWTCAKGIYGPACAEHALALMLAAARRLKVHAQARSWVQPGLGSSERRLHGLTAVIVGTGGIGAALACLLEPLSVRVLGVNRSGRPLAGAEATVTVERLDEVLPEADFVVVAAALTAQTRALFDAARLARMKPDAWLVNVARGGLVVTDDLVEALRAGTLGGAALDVTDPEPLPDGHPLWEFDNALITPHIANTWDMALPELIALVERNVARFAAGEPLEGLVDPALGY
jgi:D-3-phosphoglycerate dehydrogenase